MDREMVMIFIKSPNQKIKDHVLSCELSWTIREIKGILSEVYPGNPHPDGQKLIYSGRLLPDGAVLAEILMSYDGEPNNTFHLVCCPSSKDIGSTNLENSATQTCEARPATPTQEREVPAFNLRSSSGSYFGVPQGPMAQYFNGYEQQYMYQQQMIWMQQAYIQYMTQYMQMAYNANIPRTHQEREPTTPPAPEAPPNRGGEEEVEEDGRMHRDWLDWVYIVSRIAVLFSVVYFYSSPIRCVMVTTMALLLYHLGMLRWRPVQNNNNNNVNNNNRVEEEGDEARDGDATEETPLAHAPPDTHYPNWLVIVWTFLSSFFLSLIPEQREV